MAKVLRAAMSGDELQTRCEAVKLVPLLDKHNEKLEACSIIPETEDTIFEAATIVKPLFEVFIDILENMQKASGAACKYLESSSSVYLIVIVYTAAFIKFLTCLGEIVATSS
ncbi:hypothetical protein ACFFRR_010983 [Megaselia abdita]